ncbi:MAG: hypothetical protein M3680_03355 [Myxococcota bacterium]|nr:hypothetical protein [Myxococcota bacterium]
MRAVVVILMVSLVAATATSAHAAPPEPSGPHPRILLDAELRAAWQTEARADRGPVKGAIALCQSARDTSGHDRAVYQGSEWAKILQACLVAWAATDQADYAKVAIRFYTALLDDLDRIGDGLGGEQAASRDSGYAIRNLGPYTAIAYDWLHAQLSPALRAKARQRWAAWLRAYREKGYRARVPGTNYQAGYLVSATLIAVAQGSEAGEEGTLLWQFVADELWGKDMAAALATGGILDGGDWPEGWQYGPLAVTSYALAARVGKRAGLPIEGVEPWLASMLRRHVYGLSPVDKVFPGGDTEEEAPNLAPHVNTLNAMALGDASAETKRWAKGELSRLRLTDRDYLLHDALATVGPPPAPVPRETWPTWYVAGATGTLYARTRWDAQAMWFVTHCQRSLDIDHRHPSTGNFVLTRGKDDVIVDPSPYGSASTLTSNAPTVASAHLPPDYIPSQGGWGQKSGWDWTTQTRSGVVAARCDYSDQFRFQHRPSDVPEALRDYVLLPGSDGTQAQLVVVDRATTTAAKRAMHLRFRVPGPLELAGDAATTTIGGTQLAITTVARTGGSPEKGRATGKDCFAPGIKKGQCDAARFPVTDYRLLIPGPEPRAVHVISALAPGATATQQAIGDKMWSGVALTGPRTAVVVWPHKPRAAFSYRAPRGDAVSHVVLDAPEVDGMMTITAKPEGDGCAVTLAAGGPLLARPAIVTLDQACQVAGDSEAASAASSIGTKPPAIKKRGKPRRSGCCGAQTTPGSPIAMTLVVLVLVLRRRGSRRGAR